jgi:hypothetical protein
LASGSPGFRQPASELYDLLLKPAAAQLQGRTALVIVPDGALWELPFQTLQPGPNRYLIEDSAIAYAPSLTALREMNKLRDRKKYAASSPTLLAFGNPAFGQQKYFARQAGADGREARSHCPKPNSRSMNQADLRRGENHSLHRRGSQRGTRQGGGRKLSHSSLATTES